ncbi:MAG: DUF948 domain-containing protein [Candidatus Rokuibacteriota bacterium]
MLNYAVLLASLAFVVLVAFALPALLQIRRTARAAELTLTAVEREVRPLASQLHALLQEHRELAQRASRNLRELEGVAIMGQEVLARAIRLTGILGGAGTVGRVLGVAQGLRRGVDVFIQRLGRGRSG